MNENVMKALKLFGGLIICFGLIGAGVYQLGLWDNALEEKCMNGCSNFNYTFYQIDWNGNCWCLDRNNEPKEIGHPN